MGPGYYIEGDNIEQKATLNGVRIPINKEEPLLAELNKFIYGGFTELDLEEAMYNLKLVTKWVK